jgi:hypothetical protein
MLNRLQLRWPDVPPLKVNETRTQPFFQVIPSIIRSPDTVLVVPYNRFFEHPVHCTQLHSAGPA